MRDRLSASALAPAVGAFLLLFLLVAPAHAQDGVITGTVTSQEGQPLAGAQVSLTQTGYGVTTNENGVYRIPDVRPGTYNLEVTYIGYATTREQNVVVDEGELVTIDVQLSRQTLQLQGIRVTGVADPIEGIRMPFSISRVEMEDITVPAHQDMASIIRGRVAGARVVSSSGMPGSGVSIRLRARHGVNTSDSPLMVIDGVLQTQSTVDLDALDIESVEVLKGAAAASLYGSRAQAGVIEIATRRGREVGVGQTRITLRSEIGQSFLGDVPSTATHHPYLMNDNGDFIDEEGNVVARVDRVLADDRMVDNPYTGQLYNHLETFFDPGRFVNNTVNIAQNTNSTNFFASFADSRESGVIPDFNEGYHRQNMRFNIDHRMRSDLTVGFTVFHSKSSQQDLQGGNPFYNLRFIAPDVDLTAPNPDGQPYIIRPDSTSNENSPLYALWAEDQWDYRQRTQGSLQARFNPFSWLNIDGLLAYDRSDREEHRVRPQDFLTADPDVTLDGIVSREHDYDEGINGHLQTTLIRSFGDLTARTRLRWNFEREEESGFDADGNGYIVKNVPTLNNMQERDAGGAEFDRVRAEGYMINTGLDYQGKYIGDFLIRRDGSSLFGPENRWHTYYRASLSYLMSEEDWWPLDFITAFKPRYSIGTAGARPGFSWRYETWSVGSSGPSKGRLGNQNLAPEVTTEQDIGLDLIINDRYSVELTYAKSTVDDQLVPVPLPSFFGYGSQWQNAGQVKTEAYEATFEAALVQNQDMSWNMGLVLDHSKSWLSEWERTCYRTSNFYRCQGESFSTMRRRTWMTSHDDLPDFHSGSMNQFQVNDEGYLVPVGDADYTDGLNSDGTVNRWGTRVEIDGVEYDWGIPIFILTEDATPENPQVDDLHKAGDANPDFHLGWTNRVRWKGFTFSSLLDAKVGGDVYNGTAQWPYRDNMSMDQVQAGKPLELKKPLDYYQALYAVNSGNSHFIEDGSYVKIRELQVGYRIGRETLNRFLPASGLGVQSMALNLIGRNLFTFTDYSGIDPEVGSGGAGGPTENPSDSFDYPNFRQFTFSVEVQF